MIEFLGCSCFLSAFEASSGSYRKHGLWSCQHRAYSVLDVTSLPTAGSESCWTPTHCVSEGSLWPPCNPNAVSEWDSRERGKGEHTHCTHVLCSQHIPSSHPTSLKSIIPKMKLLTYQDGENRALNQARGPPEDRALKATHAQWSCSCIWPRISLGYSSTNGFLSGYARCQF